MTIEKWMWLIALIAMVLYPFGFLAIGFIYHREIDASRQTDNEGAVMSWWLFWPIMMPYSAYLRLRGHRQ